MPNNPPLYHRRQRRFAEHQAVNEAAYRSEVEAARQCAHLVLLPIVRKKEKASAFLMFWMSTGTRKHTATIHALQKNPASPALRRRACKRPVHFDLQSTKTDRHAVTRYETRCHRVQHGGGKDISGAITQTDVLGIYGRYGVYAACKWGIGASATAQVAGFRAYLNFDGEGARFDDTAVRVQGVNSAELSVYAALDIRKVGRTTIATTDKTNATQPVQLAM